MVKIPFLSFLVICFVPWSEQQSTMQPIPAINAKVILSNSDTVSGSISFTQACGGCPVFITGTVTGLTPGPHGFHVHTYGDISTCSAAGPHFNPRGVPHGAPENPAPARHEGDFGNIIADSTGVATISITDSLITLVQGQSNSIIGRAIVVHAGADDLGLGGDAGSVASGNAGARLACGVVGIAASTTT